jgi:hypothetical protein
VKWICVLFNSKDGPKVDNHLVITVEIALIIEANSLMTASIYSEMEKHEIIIKLLLPFFSILFGKPKYTSISRKDLMFNKNLWLKLFLVVTLC